MATLERIWIKRAHRGVMDPVETGVLDTDKGLRESANYAGRRHVTIISRERWAEMMTRLGANVDPSARRANLMVSGLELEGTTARVLRVGSCLLRVGGETRPCERMEEAYPGLQDVMRPHWGGGAWAQVIAGGAISVGDTVEWQEDSV
jgi:MOSC domain-containing protein YiiM